VKLVTITAVYLVVCSFGTGTGTASPCRTRTGCRLFDSLSDAAEQILMLLTCRRNTVASRDGTSADSAKRQSAVQTASQTVSPQTTPRQPLQRLQQPQYPHRISVFLLHSCLRCTLGVTSVQKSSYRRPTGLALHWLFDSGQLLCLFLLFLRNRC